MGAIMEKKVTIVVIDRGEPQATLMKCLTYIQKQTQVEKEVVLITPKSAMHHFEGIALCLNQPATVPFETVVKLANRWATGDYITFLSAADFYLKEKALATCLTELTAKQADMGVANLVTLVDGTFQFKANPTNLHGLITTNNILPYMRIYEAFRGIEEALFSRELLAAVVAEHAVTSEQRLLYFLVHECQKAVLLTETLTCFVPTAAHPLPAFQWEADYEYSNAHRFVQAIQQSDYQPQIDERIKVTIGLDDGLVPHLEAFLHSLDSNTDTPVDVYIIYASLTPASQARLKYIASKLEAVKLILRPAAKALRQFIENIPMDKARLPIGTYFRIIVPEVLRDLPRVIYLDVDMIVQTSLKDLWQTPLEGNFIGVCEDSLVPYYRRTKTAHQLFGQQGTRYFNAGMMVMDLTLMRRYNTTFYSAQLALDTADVLKYADQDVQNLYFYGANKQLEVGYNYGLEYVQISDRPLSDVAIIHYYGWKKPWMNMVTETYMHPSRRPAMHLYRKYHNEMKAILNDDPQMISVIIDTTTATGFNFERCFEGFFTQTYTNLEFLVVTDGELAPALQRYLTAMQAYYPSLKVVVGTTLDAVDQAQGDYLYFFNLDDLLLRPTALADLVKAGQAGAQIVCSAHQRLDFETKTTYWRNQSGQSRSLTPAERTTFGEESISLAGLLVTATLFNQIQPVAQAEWRPALFAAATQVTLVEQNEWIQTVNQPGGENDA